MKLVFAPEALADIEEIYRHVSSQSLQMAEKIEVAIRLASERCASTPYIYPATARKSVRRYPLRRYGFTIFYRVTETRDAVDIFRVVRGMRVKNLRKIPRV